MDHPPYVPLAARSHPILTSRLDPDQDEEIIETQIREREAAQRREEEAREREAELARKRLEEERLAKEEEERRQAEREKALEKRRGVGRGVSKTADPSSSGVRGVRGTRASMRARGVATGIARGMSISFLVSGSCFERIPKARPPPRRTFLGLLPRHRIARA